MKTKFFVEKASNIKIRKTKSRKTKYQSYVTTFFIALATFLLSRVLLDVNILLSTGRFVGTEDWINLAFSQKERRAANIPFNEKRILIIAGSNGLFGVSAKTISKKTGIETVNLSTHASLGGNYILNRAEKLIREGDILLLPLEYPFYSSPGISDNFRGGRVLAPFLISYDREALRSISVISLLNFILSNSFSLEDRREYFSYFQGRLSKEDISERLIQQSINPRDNCYSGLTLNEYGDETCNTGKENAPLNPAVLETAMPRAFSNIDPDGYIEKFVQSAKSQGAEIIPLYPVSTYTDDYQQVAYQQSAQNIKRFWEEQGVKFQDSLEDSLLPPNLMYNTSYHPKDTGRKIRTKSIIKIIKRQLKDVEK